MPRSPSPQRLLPPRARAPADQATPRPRDYQRARLYRWESAHVLPLDRELLPLPACAALVERAFRWAEGAAAERPGWRPPRVEDGRGRRHACGSREAIKLPRWARTRPVVLHECAHGLRHDLHGPRFVACYVELLVTFLGFDRAVLLRSLAQHKLRVAIADGLRPSGLEPAM